MNPITLSSASRRTRRFSIKSLATSFIAGVAFGVVLTILWLASLPPSSF